MNVDGMTNGQKKNALGSLAEEFVMTYYYNSRKGAALSWDPYDRQKDLILGDGTWVEIKAQKRHMLSDCFGINRSQIEKCERVDELLFVEHFDFADLSKTVPHESRECIRIYKCKNQKDHFSLADQFRNVASKEFYSIKTNTILLAEIKAPVIAEIFRLLTTSKY